MARQRLLLLDLDNTLIDRAGLFRGWALDFLERQGLDALEVDWLVDRDGDGLVAKDVFFEQVRARYRLDATVAALQAEYHERYPAFTVPPPAATVEALVTLRQRQWRLGIVTNGPPMQEAVVDNAGLRAHVDAVCVSALVGVRKPDPAIFVLAAEICGAEAADNWMLGDSPDHDIAGASAAGMRAGWIARGRSWSATSAQPTLVADDVAQAVAMVLASEDGA